MNSLLANSKENFEKHMLSCLYCKKMFNSHQALGGHVKIHHEEIKSGMRLNDLCHRSRSVEINGTKPYSFLDGQLENSSAHAEQILPLLKMEPFPLSFSNGYSHAIGLADASKSVGNNLENAKSQRFTVSKLSSPSGNPRIHHYNDSSLRALAPLNMIGRMSPSTFASPVAAGILSCPPLHLCTSRVYLFNAVGLPRWRDSVLSLGNALQTHNHQDLRKVQHRTFATADPHLVHISNRSLGLKESMIDSFRHDYCRYSGQVEIGQSNKSNVLTCGGTKRPISGDAQGYATIVNAPKKHKMSCNSHEPAEKYKKKEWISSKGVEHCFGMGISLQAEGDLGNLDLSLHL